MTSSRGVFLTLAVGLGLTGLFLCQLSTYYHTPYPSLVSSLRSSETDLQDVGGIALGIRRLAADLAWVQTLQYYGTPEEGQTEFEFENGLGNYPRFLAYCQRVASIDPYFTYVYYYGGSVLGWNLNRLTEAEDLLKQGIAANPQEWRLPLYLAGLAYQKNHDTANLTTFLESVVKDPECPLMMKAMLANLYKKQRQYGKALRLWQVIYDSGDSAYQHQALIQFKQVQRLIQTPPLDK